MGKTQDKLNRVWNIRLTEAEHLDLVDKITREDGSAIMSKSAFGRAILTQGKVTVVDHEIERYQAFVFARFSNNFNQLVKLLNSKHLSGELEDDTVLYAMSELQDLRDELSQQFTPISVLKNEDS